MIRFLRRQLIKGKCGLRRLPICLIILVLVIYVLYVLITTSGNRQVWDASGLQNVSGAKCGVQCMEGQVAFYIKSGKKTEVGPTICYEGLILMSPEMKNYQRGINAVFINDVTREVVDIKNFDTYVEENPLIKYLKRNVPNNYVMILASYDEMTDSLKEDGRHWLKLFGSSLIDKLKYRDSFIMIGQKGLKKGHALEYVNSYDERKYADPVEKYGCFSIPMGHISSYDLKQLLPLIKQAKDITIGPDYANCGMPAPCDKDSFSVMLSTGKDTQVVPQICVDGKMIVDMSLNDGGRGFNIVIVDPKTSKPIMVSRFDTYVQDSTNLEIFLESLTDGVIILATVHDDASKKMSFIAREMMNQFGSSMLQNLKFRDVWIFVGQTGISGFTKMEQISYAGMHSEWPKPLRKSFCVPRKIIGSQIIPDPLVYRNDLKRVFCVKYDGYADFCDVELVDQKIESAPIVSKDLRTHKIYTTPVIVIPGMNHNALVRTVETIMMQPGIDPAYVVIMWDEKFPEYAELGDLFGFRNFTLPGSVRYSDIMTKAIDAAWAMFPDSDEVIILEEELLLAPDFLNFMAQAQTIIKNDPTIYGVSAWNYNGYEATSGNQSILYRVEEFPGLGFMLKKFVYFEKMKGRMDSCCSRRVWDNWWSELKGSVEMLVPDVSRVYREPYHGSLPGQDYVLEIFNRQRRTNLEGLVLLTYTHNMTADKYDHLIGQLLIQSEPVDYSVLHRCFTDKDFLFTVPKTTKKSLSLFYEQTKYENYTLLNDICRCFGLYSHGSQKPKNLYRGLLRFFYQEHDMFLVGSKSKFFSHKPKSLQPFAHVEIKVS